MAANQTQATATARRFRELATGFDVIAERFRQNDELFVKETELLGHQKLRHDAGSLVIAAHQRGLLDLPGLAELVRYHTGELAEHPNPPVEAWEPGPANLLHEVFGIVETEFSKSESFPGKMEVRQKVSLRGILPTLYPEHFPLNPYFRTGEGEALREWLAMDGWEGLRREGSGCRLLADLIESAPATAEAAEC